MTFKLSEKQKVEPDLRSPSPNPRSDLNPKCINPTFMKDAFILSEKLTVEPALTSPSPNLVHIRAKAFPNFISVLSFQDFLCHKT